MFKDLEKLKKLIKEEEVILFVGAGVSATLKKFPLWSELIEHIANELSVNPEDFDDTKDSLILAEYYSLKKGKNYLKNWMKNSWKVSDEEIKKSRIYKNIVELNFPIIYTTNYDHCLEQAFKVFEKSFTKIKNIDDLVHLDPDKTQIIKFHGDMDSETPLVLTEKSYFERLDFNSPLDIKLRADMLGKSVLFIGYSLSDINIRLLVYKLNQLWSKSNTENKPDLYIFMAKPNIVQEEVLKTRGVIPIIGEKKEETQSLDIFLESLRD